LIVSVDMNVGRLVRFVAIEIHAVGPHRHDGWHAFSISPLDRQDDTTPTGAPFRNSNSGIYHGLKYTHAALM
jgi:hypothetical protein